MARTVCPSDSLLHALPHPPLHSSFFILQSLPDSLLLEWRKLPLAGQPGAIRKTGERLVEALQTLVPADIRGSRHFAFVAGDAADGSFKFEVIACPGLFAGKIFHERILRHSLETCSAETRAGAEKYSNEKRLKPHCAEIGLLPTSVKAGQ